MRFSLRWLLGAIGWLALFLALGSLAGYLVAAGLTFACLSLVKVVCWRPRGERLFARVVAAGCALLAIWMLAVDGAVVHFSCPACGLLQYSYQVRVLTLPIYTQVRESPSMVQLALADLGAPCPHAEAHSWQRYRLWGLALVGFPRINGIVWVSGDTSPYTDAVAARWRRLGAEDPQRAAHLRDLIVRHDQPAAFWRELQTWQDETPAEGVGDE